MRHVIGIVLAVGLAAAVFFAAGWGYARMMSMSVTTGTALPGGGGSLLHSTGVLEAAGALAGTALLAGIFIAAPRISPLAAGLPGLVLVAWTVVYGFNVRRAVHYIPLRGDTFGAGFEALLFSGILGAAGLALVVPLFIPSRWRRASHRWAGAAAGPAGQDYAYGYLDSTASGSESPTITLLTDDYTETTPPPNNP